MPASTPSLPKEIEFTKWLIRGFAAALPSLVIAVTAIAWFGDLLYATQPELDLVKTRVTNVESTIKNHVEDDVHMPESVKRATFADKIATEKGLDSVNKKLDTIMTLLVERLPKS